MTANTPAPRTDYIRPLRNPRVGDETTLLRGAHKGKSGVIVSPYRDRVHLVQITVGGKARIVRAHPGSLGPRQDG